jgi:hypothetical protein
MDDTARPQEAIRRAQQPRFREIGPSSDCPSRIGNPLTLCSYGCTRGLHADEWHEHHSTGDHGADIRWREILDGQVEFTKAITRHRVS